MKKIIYLAIILGLFGLSACGKPDTSVCSDELSEETCLYYLQ